MARHRVLRKTKVIATIGPACDSLETLKSMIRAGMNVARLNFSHGTHEEHRRRLEMIRQAVRELEANVAVMLDTRGVEIRTGRLEGGLAQLKAGERFTLDSHSRLHEAIEQYLFEERRDVLRLVSSVTRPDEEAQQKISAVEERLVTEYGYDSHSAREALNYVTTLLSQE